MIHREKLLQSFMNRESKHRDIYHDMMPFKVKEILLVANLYDAFFIEQEGRFSEIMLYDYGSMNLSSFPRITGVSTREEAFEQLEEKKIDMVILMVGLNMIRSLDISKKIKEAFPGMPVFVLLNNNQNVTLFQQYQKKNVFDQLFVWNGESRIFFAMIKYLEDLKNAKNDTSIAAVRQILIVEDSPVFYSSFLTHLYRIIYKQTNEIINDVSTDNLYKVLKLRARPKILLASNFEDAMALFHEYKDYIFCLITDVQYEKEGKMNKDAGFELIDAIAKEKPDIPTIVLSQDESKGVIARERGISFIDKNAQNLYKDLKHVVTQKIGFGAFIFRNRDENEIARARNIKEFEECLNSVPDESILFHGEQDHFSLWLMARAEIQLATLLVGKKASEFKNAHEIREYLLNSIRSYRDEQPSGKVIPFDVEACKTEENIVTLVAGSYGGKGRGLAFVHSLKDKFVFERAVEGIKIRIPKTSVIGTDEFESFLERNNFVSFKETPPAYEEVKRLFLEAQLSDLLNSRLSILLDYYINPLAIRSSGTFEDSFSQPFAGIFETYILPNNAPQKAVRLRQLQDAIKLVFASVFSEKAINYTLALDQKLGEEKMAIVIQELVGNEFDGCYYPHISGVGQSYNFYPFAHMKPEEGFVTAAIGLGIYVVEGEMAFRFSPKYPKTQFLSLEDQVKYTQTYFYAVDLNKENLNLAEGSMSSLKKVDIFEARDHGSLVHCVSVYDNNNKAIYPGLKHFGPIVVNFASILKYEYVALAKTIEIILGLIKDAFGSPVEIEFAVDLNKDADGDASFYILQVKPIIRAAETYSFNFDKIPKEDTFLFANRGMGNGVIEDLSDFVFIKNDVFDKIRTEEMAEEIALINKKLIKEGRKYILIGPGRWGTRDRFIGIPVNWPQISNAQVIVETELEGFPLDASYGSHFFHNLTTLNIAYFSISHKHDSDFIHYSLLEEGELMEETTFFKHVRFNDPVLVKIDGRKRMAVIHREREKGKG